MKRLLCVFVIVGFAAAAAFSQETVSLTGSNQNLTTLNHEVNEYDYLINPLYFGLLSNPWLFFALDTDVPQLGANIVGDGFRIGWARGGEPTPVFLANYRTNMNNLDSSKPDDNVEITRTGYDTVSGTYASIVESVSENVKANEQVHDLVLHGGMSLSDTLALAAQLGVAIDRWNVQSVDYTNTYTNTAAISEASLSTKGDLTETDISMRDNSDNHYALDVEAGVHFSEMMSRVVLGLGWYNPHSAGNSYTRTVTVYNAGGGIDDTVRDSETITSNTGQYTYNGLAPTAAFTMTGTGVGYTEYLQVGVDSETMMTIGEGIDLTVPLGVAYTLFPGTPQTVASTTTVNYDDASATSLETDRSTTTTTTTLSRPLDLMVQTGADVGKSVSPAPNTVLHLGADLAAMFSASKDTRSQTQVQRTQIDNDGDGAYTTVGTDVDTTYTQSGYEVQNQVLYTVGTLSIDTSVTYTPIPILSFHAGASAGLSVEVTSTSTLTTGDAAYVYEQYTDNLDSANSYTQRQIDGSSNDSIPSTSMETNFFPLTDAEFGFTLNFSDNFKVDARSVYSGNVGFSEFSVLGMYSY